MAANIKSASPWYPTIFICFGLGILLIIASVIVLSLISVYPNAKGDDLAVDSTANKTNTINMAFATNVIGGSQYSIVNLDSLTQQINQQFNSNPFKLDVQSASFAPSTSGITTNGSKRKKRQTTSGAISCAAEVLQPNQGIKNGDKLFMKRDLDKAQTTMCEHGYCTAKQLALIKSKITSKFDSTPFLLNVELDNGNSISTTTMFCSFGSDSTCTLTFASPVTYAPGTDAEVVYVADFNMDNKKDFAVLYSGPGITSILLGKGDGTFQQPISFSNGSNSQPGAIIAGDFNNDNKVDIVVANLGSNNVDVFLGNDAGYFTLLNECFTGTNSTPAGVTLGDFNNDNILDFIVACESGNEVDVYLGIGYGSFYNYQTYPTGDNSGPTTSVVGDFNKDGQLDFIVSCFYGNNIIVYLGHGNGNFMQESTYSTDAGPYTPVTEDFNNDGILDVATSNYYANTTSVFLGNRGGTFVLVQTVSTGTRSLPFDITAADFNNDQIVDLIVPNSGTNNVGILLGTGSGTFQKVLTHSAGANSSPFTADVGDFNGNGRIDAVAANQQAGDAAVLLNTCS